MRFAEMTQEVQIPRPTPMRAHLQDDTGYTPGRRKANQLFKLAVNNLEEHGYHDAKKLEIDLGLVYSLGPNFPDYQVKNPHTSALIKDLMELLVQRIEKRRLLVNDLGARRK
jgi:kinesin family member 23